MKKTHSYTQCIMTQGKRIRVGWLPTKFARSGHVVDLKLDGVWSKRWYISSIGLPHDAVYIEAREHDYKKQRKASDI